MVCKMDDDKGSREYNKLGQKREVRTQGAMLWILKTCVQRIALERVPIFDKLNLLGILTEVKTQGQSLAACATKVYINPLDLSPAKRKNQVNDTGQK